MRKQIIPPIQQNKPPPVREWLPLDQIAQVEVTSEEVGYPVESALLPEGGNGWRAATPGAQIIRLRFDAPQTLRQIRLHFAETEMERTQEFVLRYSDDYGQSHHEIVRQQWNFSPGGTTSEIEEYQLELAGVTTLELAIIPDISDGDARASLAELRLA